MKIKIICLLKKKLDYIKVRFFIKIKKKNIGYRLKLF